MKYAFVFGTNVYLSDTRTVSYANTETRIEFLKVLSSYHHRDSKDDHTLAIDATISSSNDEGIRIENNRLQANSNLTLEALPYRVRVFHTGHAEPILDVYQLPEDQYDALDSHITNEIEVLQPEAVFTIKGDFKVDGHRILIDNEKLFVDGDSYATGKTNAHQGVMLTPYGVLS
ncbi:hypothetical protein HH214_14905 [Mucilaginibacter robiniae]|uniref:Uncharacterized protein n=1 Tax=Mucilaginibacter robiniae TaxID=2728022 RepID=A0A7L5E1L7_9SPHI|nr:hypothetical protein [Mucilaginibacter robiniae]QJD97065.1 hypothetical protein HH214_14905 [Mucilaginibacter robiniae]